MAKPTINYAHLCDYAFFTQGQKLGIIGIFENIGVQSFPSVHKLMYLVASINVPKAGVYKNAIVFTDETGNPIAERISVEAKVEEGVSRMGLVVALLDTPFKEAGKYFLKIYVDDLMIEQIQLLAQKI